MAGGIGTYLLQLWDRASKGTVLLTDRLSILVGPFATLAVWVWRKDMQDSLPEILSIGIAITVFGVVILRLLASPYLVWKDQNAMIATLDIELAKPEQIERKWLADHLAKTRSELAGALAQACSFALGCYSTNPKRYMESDYSDAVVASAAEDFNIRHGKYKIASETARVKAYELSYIPSLSERCSDLVRRCDLLYIASAKDSYDPSSDMQLRDAISKERADLIKLLHHR